MTFEQWRLMHPIAAQDIDELMQQDQLPNSARGDNESANQQAIRLDLARQGAVTWRNNVGATPAKTEHSCPKCGFRFAERKQPVRYGLANDSQQLNQSMKSSDLILMIPRLVTPGMVGTTIAQFGAVECKRPGWQFKGDKHELAQQKFLTFVASKGGFASFASGTFNLDH